MSARCITSWEEDLMKKSVIMLSCAVFFGVVVLAPDCANAGYLDPGSGSTAVQWIIAAIASLGKMKRVCINAFSKVTGR